MVKTNAKLDGMILLDRRIVEGIINTLKTIDVRGFDSMDSLVGSVMMLQQALSQPPIQYETIQEVDEKEVIQDG